ncbi:type IV toxin-antitoxin system AbiEi family antitoxin domain-containing protein [Myxococcus sp. AM001]|nr:type IV toxin-antitoxin system AbiEi family antitoxin domain-containing protein [Myxococcus sp. AM001]
MGTARRGQPDSDRLFDIVAGQAGLFTAQQALEAGYSAQVLAHHVRAGRFLRVLRGIYRWVHFPASEHEDLVAVWLWSERQGVFSHETALALHGLSDVLPSRVHLTLPAAWKQRRFRVPPGAVLHHADVGEEERVWFGPIPGTSPRRTLLDCATAHVSPDLLNQAIAQALSRGLILTSDLVGIQSAAQRP